MTWTVAAISVLRWHLKYRSAHGEYGTMKSSPPSFHDAVVWVVFS